MSPRLRSAARALRRVPVGRWPGLARAVVLAVGVEVGLRTVHLPRLARWMGVPLAPVERGASAGLGLPAGPGVRVGPGVSAGTGVPAERGVPAGPGASALPASPPGPLAPEDDLALTPQELAAIQDARRVLGTRPFNGTCLRRSLLVGNALRSRAPRLVLGVAKRDGTVTAHAWIEVQGWTIDDYHLFPRPPATYERLGADARAAS